MAEMKFVELTVDHLFDCCAVLDAIGVEEIVSAFSGDDAKVLVASGKDARGVGVAVVSKICSIIVKSVPKARNEICTFLANCVVWEDDTKVTSEDIRKLKLTKFITLIKDFCKQDDVADFFGEVAKSVGMGQTDSSSLSTTDTATQSDT